MKWHQLKPYLWERECGKYTVDVFEVQGRQRFTAWKRSGKRDEFPAHLGCFDSMMAAVAACSAAMVAQRVAA